MFLIVKISKIKLLFSSQNSWFWRKFLFSNEWDFEENFSFSFRMNEILQTDSLSLLQNQNFERKKSLSPFDSSLNFSSTSREDDEALEYYMEVGDEDVEEIDVDG